MMPLFQVAIVCLFLRKVKQFFTLDFLGVYGYTDYKKTRVKEARRVICFFPLFCFLITKKESATCLF